MLTEQNSWQKSDWARLTYLFLVEMQFDFADKEEFTNSTNFRPMFLFYIILKTSENLAFSDIFKGYTKGSLTWNWWKPWFNYINCKAYPKTQLKQLQCEKNTKMFCKCFTRKAMLSLLLWIMRKKERIFTNIKLYLTYYRGWI